MGGTQSAEPVSTEKGYRVLNVQPNSPAEGARLKPFFDFILNANGVALDHEDSTFVDLIKAHENKDLVCNVYSAQTKSYREVALKPRAGWGGVGLLGCMIRFDTVTNVDDNVWHVVDVYPNSPASVAGLEAESDYIVGTSTVLFKSEEDLQSTVVANMGKKVYLLVYSTRLDSLREVPIIPNSDWGGVGSLGCELGHGLLHRIPTRTVPASLRGPAPAHSQSLPSKQAEQPHSVTAVGSQPADAAVRTAPAAPAAVDEPKATTEATPVVSTVAVAEGAAKAVAASQPPPSVVSNVADEKDTQKEAHDEDDTPPPASSIPSPMAGKVSSKEAPSEVSNPPVKATDEAKQEPPANAEGQGSGSSGELSLPVVELLSQSDLKGMSDDEKVLAVGTVLKKHNKDVDEDSTKAVMEKIQAGTACLAVKDDDLVLASFKLNIIVEKESDPDAWLLTPGHFNVGGGAEDSFHVENMYVKGNIHKSAEIRDIVRGVGSQLFPGVDIEQVDMGKYFDFSSACEIEICSTSTATVPTTLDVVYYAKAVLRASTMDEVPFAANGMCVFSTQDSDRLYSWAWMSSKFVGCTGKCHITIHTEAQKHTNEIEVKLENMTPKEKENGQLTLSPTKFNEEYSGILKALFRTAPAIKIKEPGFISPVKAEMTFVGFPQKLARRPMTVELAFDHQHKAFASETFELILKADVVGRAEMTLELRSGSVFNFLKK